MKNIQKAFELLESARSDGLRYYQLSVSPHETGNKYTVYTPQTGHECFYTVGALMEYVERIAGNGANSVAMIVAKERLETAYAKKEAADEEISELTERIAAFEDAQ